LLKSNPTLIPGKQIQGVQLHKASAGLDYQSLQGFEARVDSYYVGEYNSYNRLPFFYANATLSQRAGRGTTLNVGVLNLFNSNVSTFNSTGDTPFIAENRFGTDQNATQQNANLGIQNSALLPITAVFSITQRI
jgi:outer membrane receptor protein involved in Fe transport